MTIRPVQDKFLHKRYVGLVDLLWVSQNLGHVHRDADLFYMKVGIGGNHGTRREVNSFSRQVTTEAPLKKEEKEKQCKKLKQSNEIKNGMGRNMFMYLNYLFSFKSLNESSSEFLRGNIGRNSRELRVIVESALQLEKVPVILNHLGCRAVLSEN